MGEDIATCIKGIVDETKVRFVELPVDADGVPIHVGDTLYVGKTSFEVNHILLKKGGSWSIFDTEGHERAGHDATHDKPDTWEDILSEAARLSGDINSQPQMISLDEYYDGMSKLVGRCKKLSKKEGLME